MAGLLGPHTRIMRALEAELKGDRGLPRSEVVLRNLWLAVEQEFTLHVRDSELAPVRHFLRRIAESESTSH